MATFTNYATLSYRGGTINSNTVTGEILETITAAKTAVTSNYTANGDVTYVISLVNSSNAPVNGLTVRDDLGGYTVDGNTVYPLAYMDGTVRYFVNGVLQAAPAVTSGPPLTISGINVPAGGSVLLIYETSVTNYAPLGVDAVITNTATVTGGGLTEPVTATETIETEDVAALTIIKALDPAVVTDNSQITYTFVIENRGNTAVVATDDVVVTDTFDPILENIVVSFNGVTWTAGTNYTYNSETGVFSSLPGQITIPAATYTQNTDGTWTITPGVGVLTVTGTI